MEESFCNIIDICKKNLQSGGEKLEPIAVEQNHKQPKSNTSKKSRMQKSRANFKSYLNQTFIRLSHVDHFEKRNKMRQKSACGC